MSFIYLALTWALCRNIYCWKCGISESEEKVVCLKWVLIQLDREYVRHPLFMKEVNDVKSSHQSDSEGLNSHLRMKHLGVVLSAALLSRVSISGNSLITC